ncbi:CBASS cGAMP-activated phospholipase [Oceanivirga miroungae]|uniref:Putative sporulation hydrolase CotR n=1 Tax=Oceanivirga miroungae TaxID=1130046 RepID=A0A6I8MDH1_9FUSO|nr:CBASS cGAMP-activated phospholipase [Oceanivirga miroungae]VWL85502.1 putative sporulation hydrolase CotR [Oceanivirga miroungae]
MFKILCLDGGGAKGYFSVYILKRIEEEFNIKLNDYFDLIVGTSTGALISAAISADISLNDLSEMYLTKNKEIFKKRSNNFLKLKSTYITESFEEELKKILKDLNFSDLKTNIMLQTTDIEKKEPIVFKSWDKDNNICLVDAVISSASAPIYFDPHQVGDKLYADGAIWANNPSVVAIAEAISKDSFKQSLDNIKILSIATGKNEEIINFSNQKNWGLLAWANDIMDIIIESNNVSDELSAKKILDDRYLRINYKLKNKVDIEKIPTYVLENSEEIFMNYYEDIKKFINLEKNEKKKYNLVQRVAKYIFRI